MMFRSYGSVVRATHRQSGRVVAIKIIPIESETDIFIKETQLMKKCNSEFIVKYFGSYVKNVDLWVSSRLQGYFVDYYGILWSRINERLDEEGTICNLRRGNQIYHGPNSIGSGSSAQLKHDSPSRFEWLY